MSAAEVHDVAVVEDEDGIRESVCFALERQGYVSSGFADGAEAWTQFQTRLPALAILDIGLPGMDGLELCRRLRAASESLPIIFVTSREDEFDRVLGLELGADDYLCKPFSIRELMARVKALLRRATAVGTVPAAAESGHDGPLRLDNDRYAATWRGQPVRLTVTEFLLLDALARRPGHVRTRDQLLTSAYPNDTFASDRTIDSHVKRMRRKFLEIDPAFDAIEAVYRAGYRWRQGAE